MSHDLIIQARQDFEQIASRSKLVTWAEESEFAGQAINRNPKLAECAPQSLREAVTNVAAIGLTLNPAFGYAYLVPESVKIGDKWIAICQLRVSFKGLMKIAVDSQGISFCRAEIVRKNDAFTYNGPCDKPDHKMDAFGDRGEIVGVYCVVKTPCGDWLTDIMNKADIDKCMAAAKTKNVWQSWYEEMAKKAIIKRASKQWPMGDGGERFNQAVAVVNDAEGSEPIERDITPQSALINDFITPDQVDELVSACDASGVSIHDLEARANATLDKITSSRFGAAMSWVLKKGGATNA